MAKRDRNETEEERAERKRAKKEAKKEAKKAKKKIAKKDKKDKKKSASTTSTNVVPAKAQPTPAAAITPQRRMASDDIDSVLVHKKVNVVISLLPHALKNVQLHVENSMRQYLMKYSDGMDGVLMAYENVRTLKKDHAKGTGWILNELPYIHYDVALDACLFCPKVGSKMVGTVNECFASHVGILVFGYFNAMVAAEDLRSSGYNFNLDTSQWVAEGSENVIEPNIPVEFIVKQIHECNGIMSLEGTDLTIRLLVDEAMPALAVETAATIKKEAQQEVNVENDDIEDDIEDDIGDGQSEDRQDQDAEDSEAQGMSDDDDEE